ncbi:MAG: hypothetical protein LBJ64_09415 [Deltaproteobacteria bacterium]|jgi:hypothetical protein|nr:hypothetical protein [Deltaproteobacteria bacterium]
MTSFEARRREDGREGRLAVAPAPFFSGESKPEAIFQEDGNFADIYFRAAVFLAKKERGAALAAPSGQSWPTRKSGP